MTEEKKYEGGCHCGKVRYQVEMAIGEVIACNCSICSKSGSLLAFADKDKFELMSGEDALSSYHFNKHMIDHVFCTGCGIKSFARGKRPDGVEMAAINVRCLDGVDIEALSVKHVDGRSR